MRSNGNRFEPAVVTLCVVMLLAGCASSGPTEMLATRPEPVEPEGQVANAVEPSSVSIDGIEVDQDGSAARIAVQTSEALVWTTYRDDQGRLVIELPNSRPADRVAGAQAYDGLVESLLVTSESVANRPLTRVTIVTRSEAEHAVTAAEGGLEIELGSAAALAALAGSAAPSTETVAAVAPVMEEELGTVDEAAAVESEVAEVAVEETGAADTTVWQAADLADDAVPLEEAEAVAATVETEPWTENGRSHEAVGQAATELRDIDVVSMDNSVVVRILGDGEFSYETLSLEAPYRYVIDLAGVANFAPRGTYSAGGAPVEQVRVAQFKSEPTPVSRVVVDLAYPSTPELVGLPDGLALSFGGEAAANWSEPTTLWEDVSTDAAAEDVAATQVYEEAPAAYEESEWQESADTAAFEPVVESAPMEPTVVTQVAQVADEPMADEPMAPEPMMEEPVEDYTPVVEATPEAPMPPPAPVNIQLSETPAGDQSDVLTARESDTGGQKVYRGEPITLRLRDADIRDLLRSFSEFSGLNFVIQPGVRGTVTVELTDVPWDQALDLILKTNDLGYELEGNILRIAPLSKLRAEAEEEQKLRAAQAEAVPLAFVIRRISYANAASIANVLRSGNASVMSRRGSVAVDQRTNTLIIKELPNFIDTVIAVIETLDIPEPQVMIEARIIETTKRFSRTLGISWGFDAIASAATGNTTNLVFPNNGTASGGVNLGTAGNGSLGITLGNVLNTFQLDVALQAAENEGLINILSAPKITTLNNEAASIQSGLQIPIQTLSNNTVSVQFVNATLQLQVTPHVTAEGTVLMDIDIQKKEPLLAFAVQGASNAPISTKDARTRVLVRDGGTTVIGGIYEVTSDEGSDKVPGLSRIPLLRNLFKNNRQSEENEELLIFITPRVIKL